MQEFSERLDELWEAWTNGVPSVVLVVVVVILLLLWLTATGLVFVAARLRRRSAGGWAILTLLPTLAIAAIGIATPTAFHWWAIGALAVGPLIGLAYRALLNSSTTECTQGHVMAPGWIYCPVCPAPALRPSPAAAPALAGVSAAGVGNPTVLPPGAGVPGAFVQSPAVPGVGRATMAGPGGTPRPGGAGAPGGPALLVLVPERGSTSSQATVYAPGALIGRNPSAEVHVDDSSASWEHARIIERDGSPAIVDLGSSNGTFVNGELVETSLLIDGDRIEIGDTIFKVVRP